MRLVEIRLLDGPNVYRTEPTVKVEVIVGRARTWFGDRDPEPHARVRLAALVPPADAPSGPRDVAGWVDRLHRLTGAAAWLVEERRARTAARARIPVGIHRTSEPGHWVVTFPWRERGRAEAIAEAAFRLTDRDLDPETTHPAADGTARGSRSLARALAAIAEAAEVDQEPPEWIRDPDRRLPVISISGTNGKTTTTRMIGTILRTAGRRVGMTTSDGVLVDDVLVEEGDLTGPYGAHVVMARPDVDVAVLETARGGLVLRGVGYESNDASVITNVSSDHMDLQGLHTLPELAEVKGTITRITRPGGRVVLNAEDPLVAALARDARAPVCLFALDPGNVRVTRHVASGGTAMVVRDGAITEVRGERASRVVPVADVPATMGGLARHNVANALAAAAGARAMGATLRQVAAGLRDYRPTADQAPGRLNVYTDGRRVVIVDFAHNEAGLTMLLDAAEGLTGDRATRSGRGFLTVIVGTAGDRPDDTLRGLGRIAAGRADEVAIKETQRYLRGRTRESVIGELRVGARAAGMPARAIPVHPDEPGALRAELTDPARMAGGELPGVIVLLCHEERSAVGRVLDDLGFRAAEVEALLAMASDAAGGGAAAKRA